MIKYSIILYSKNKESLKNFFKFQKRSLEIQQFQIPFCYKKNKKTKQKISVLKSPHVNKTAQEQFELKTYSITIIVKSYKVQKYILLLKKIKNQLFPDVKIKIKSHFSIKNTEIHLKDKFINPNKFTFKILKFNFTKQVLSFKELKTYRKINNNLNKNLLEKTVNSLKIFDYCGDFNF